MEPTTKSQSLPQSTLISTILYDPFIDNGNDIEMTTTFTDTIQKNTVEINEQYKRIQKQNTQTISEDCTDKCKELMDKIKENNNKSNYYRTTIKESLKECNDLKQITEKTKKIKSKYSTKYNKKEDLKYKKDNEHNEEPCKSIENNKK